jgi:hypothetical protein
MAQLSAALGDELAEVVRPRPPDLTSTICHLESKIEYRSGYVKMQKEGRCHVF